MKKILSIFLSAFVYNFAISQATCNVDAFATSIDVLCGDTVNLNAVGEGITVFENDFDGCNIGQGWSSTQQARYDNPCNVTENGTCYLWFGNTSPAPRRAATNPLDLSTGGVIFFDMRYARQGDGSPCEGPDLPDEGVSVEFSTDNGATWDLIQYFSPNGGNDAFRTAWNQYSVNIPFAARTPVTQIRWVQNAASGAGNDHWGLEDVEIVVNPPDVTYTWQHTGNPMPTGDTPPVVPTETTTYTVDYMFGNCTNTASVTVNVAKPTATATVVPNVPLCPGDTNILTITSDYNPPVLTCGLSQSGCVGNTITGSFGNGTVVGGGYNMLGTPAGVLAVCSNGSGTPSNFGKTQFIIRAAEFPAIVDQGQIYQIELNSNINDSYNFQISMGCSGKNAYTAANQANYETGLDVVYTAKNTPLTVGWNTLAFDNHYDWDGTSDIVIQICWTATGGKAGDLRKTNTGFNSTIHNESCSSLACGGFGPDFTLSQNRPSVNLGLCYRLPPDLEITWTPTDFLDNPNGNITNAFPDSSTTYTATVRDLNTPAECAATAEVRVMRNPLGDFIPTPSGPLCLGDNLQLMANIPGMTVYSWNGPNGFTSNQENPNVINNITQANAGTYSIFVDNGAGCTSTKTLEIVIDNPPNPGTAINTELCNTGAAIDLFDFISGNDAGGIWSDDDGSGALLGASNVDPGLINDADLPGVFSFTYTLDGGACPNESTTVEVSVGRQASAGTGGDFTYCEAQGAINIFDLLSDNPDLGGTWTDDNGSGQVTGDSLDLTDLGFGLYSFTYTVASSAPCPDSSATINLTIENQPDAGRDSVAQICLGSNYNLFDFLTLNTQTDGVWQEISNSGAFTASTATFNATNIPQGTYRFRYFFTANTPCISDTAFVTLNAFGPPVISDIQDACEANNLGYRVTFRITGGDSLNYTASYPGTITGSSPYIYTSDVIPSGQSQLIEISDPIACAVASITAQKSCQCVTDAGNMRTDSLLNLCEGDSAFGIYLGGYMSDIDDTLVFYLHEGNGNQLSMPIDSAYSPNFEWNPSRISEKMYYISAVAATNRGDNWLDRSDLCLDVANGTPLIWHELPDADIDITPIDICFGDNATLNLDALSGSAPFTYDLTLNPGGNQSINAPNNAYSESISPATSTTYTLNRVTDNFGCTVGLSKAVTVNLNVAPTAQIVTAQACSGGGASFDVNLAGDGSVFDFSYTNDLDNNLVNLGNQSGPTVSITPTVFDSNAVVVYSLTSVSDNSGSVCPGVVSGTFNLFPTPSLQLLSSNGVYCQGNPIPLNYYLTGVGPWQIDASDNQGGTYTFTVNNRSGVVNITDVLNPGTYVVSFDNITDMASGCSNTASGIANITINPGPLAEVKITDPISGNPVDMVEVCENATAVDLVFTKTQGNGSINVDYTRNGNPEGSLTISGSSQTVTLANNLTPGTYAYRIKSVSDNSPASCVGSGNTVTVVVNPTPTVNAFIAASETEICDGEAFTLQYNVSGNGSITFDLINQFGDNIALSGSQNTNTHAANITPSNLGNNNYSVINVNDGSSPTCPGTSSSVFTVDVKPLPTANLSANGPLNICSGDPFVFDITTTGEGNVDVDYTDQTGAFTGTISGPSGIFTETINNLPVGQHQFTITNITSNNPQATCSATSTSTITVDVAPLPSAAPQFVPGSVTCFGDDVRLEFNFIDVTYPVDVFFNDDQGNTGMQTFTDAASSFIDVTADLSKTITITRIVGANGCESILNPGIPSTLTVNPLPTATLFGSEEVCEGLGSFINVDLTGVPPFALQYQDDMGNIYDTVIANTGISQLPQSTLNSKVYSVISISDSNNPVCSNTSNSTANITINPRPIINLMPDAVSSCSPFNVNIINLTDAPAPNTLTDCLWTLSNGTTSNDCGDFTTVLNDIGRYSLTYSATNDLGCSNTQTFVDYLRVNPDPIADFDYSPDNPDITASLIQFYNRSNGAASFNWYINGDTITQNNPQYQAPTEAGSIIDVCLEAVSNFGCTNTYCEPITIRDLELVYIPNAFTPDGDGINDVFRPSVIGLLETNYTLEIYDRWGELIFKTNQQEEGWDGIYNGEPAQSGNYSVILKGISRVDGSTEFIEYANVNLIR